MAQYDEVYEKVSEMLCDAKDLEPDALAPDSPLHQLKLDSLDYVELMVLAKKEFGVSVEAELFVNNPQISLRELCQYLSDNSK
ncbi:MULTISPECIES: acyl carrier protein [Rahnella]|jgi:acyl carrier protein|uniref:Acyl carrier protein n=1 Tax=Rahnella contaminans TaxID=2703882 RepID=A0A6M2AYI3_9GAMM|nr:MULTISPECIES: acyl carrier protein [Rahnella]KAB8308834.1 acyl carrier protein [Rouxiella chamberiensis]MBU9819588.1 acyl carrier protein [Rahnella sp. BCC 1045]MCS3421582.1 acyl carrier protein [Rahnella sp. BIGb0603]MDF1893730.1 acyl carrier protein [Rahnella contaminans]NGX85722.1 acyl carrier protein [Rahnella contaminans]